MHKLATAMIERFTTHFNAGDFLSVTEEFVFPLPIQVQEDQALISRPADLVQVLKFLRCTTIEQGLSPCIPRIVAIDIPRKGRFRLWVDWHYQSHPESDQPHTKNIYYCSAIGSRIQIEMVQYLHIAAESSRALSAFAERRSA